VVHTYRLRIPRFSNLASCPTCRAERVRLFRRQSGSGEHYFAFLIVHVRCAFIREYFTVVTVLRVTFRVARISAIFKNLPVASHCYPLGAFRPLRRLSGGDGQVIEARIAFG
jgi:hypothetical protein